MENFILCESFEEGEYEIEIYTPEKDNLQQLEDSLELLSGIYNNIKENENRSL